MKPLSSGISRLDMKSSLVRPFPRYVILVCAGLQLGVHFMVIDGETRER